MSPNIIVPPPSPALQAHPSTRHGPVSSSFDPLHEAAKSALNVITSALVQAGANRQDNPEAFNFRVRHDKTLGPQHRLKSARAVPSWKTKRKVIFPPWPKLFPGNGLPQMLHCRPKLRGLGLLFDIPEDQVVRHRTPYRPSCRPLLEYRPSKAAREVYPIHLKMRHLDSTKPTSRLMRKLRVLNETEWGEMILELPDVRICSYDQLHQLLARKAVPVAFTDELLDASDITGKVVVEFWGEVTPVTRENWRSRTLSMCGLEGAKLRFDFYVKQKEEVQPSEPSPVVPETDSRMSSLRRSLSLRRTQSA
jgi:hypothetical protein